MRRTHSASAIGLMLVLTAGVAAGQERVVIPNWPAPQSVSAPLSFVAITPCRLADTRPGQGFDATPFGPPILGAAPRDFPITSSACGVPATAQAVSANLAVVNTAGPGFLRIYPQGGSAPLVASLNYEHVDQTLANAAVLPLGPTGGVTIIAGVSNTNLIIDVNGYYAPLSSLTLSANLFAGQAVLDATCTGTGIGVKGTTGDPSYPGVQGYHTAGGPGVYGSSVSGDGVTGNALSPGANGIHGTAGGTGAGVWGQSSGSGPAIRGTGTAAGLFEGGVQVTGALNVSGAATLPGGLTASGSLSPMISATSAGDAIRAVCTGANSSGFYLQNTGGGWGVFATTNSAGTRSALHGDTSGNGYGVEGYSESGYGIYGRTNTGKAGYFQGPVLLTTLAGVGNRAVYSDASGNLTNTSSDARLKTNVVDLAAEIDVLGALARLRGVAFNWDTGVERARTLGDQREIGLVAQEVEAILPHVVGMHADGYKSVDYAKLTAFLIEVAKAQQAELSALRPLRKAVETLERRVEELSEAVPRRVP